MLHCIQGEGEARDQVRAAVQVMRGEDWLLTEVEETTELLGALFPKEAQSFLVFTERKECAHEPRCTWLDYVFYHENRCIVLTTAEAEQTSVGAVIQALKGQEAHG